MGSKLAAEEDPELMSSKTHRVYSSYEAIPTDGARGPTGHLCTATLYRDRTDNGAQTAWRTARETGSGNRSSEGRRQGTAGTAIRPGAQDDSNKDSKDPCPCARGGRPGQRHGTPCRSAFIAHLGTGPSAVASLLQHAAGPSPRLSKESRPGGGSGDGPVQHSLQLPPLSQGDTGA